jgi:hypothetical protein
MVHVWKFGDWASSPAGIIRFVSEQEPFGGRLWFVRNDGSIQSFDVESVEYLPDCNGWDWIAPKPIVAPEGHRLLAEGETVVAGDKFFNHGWNDLSEKSFVIGRAWNSQDFLPIARKIEPPRFPEVPEYQPEMWTVPKDTIYAAVAAIQSALGYMPQIKTDVPQWKMMVVQDVARMKKALEELQKLGQS